MGSIFLTKRTAGSNLQLKKMNNRILLLYLILTAGCATNPAVIKPDKNKGKPFSTAVYLNGRTIISTPPPTALSATTGKFTDERDNQVYKWVKIGTQTWMAQNLNYKTATGSVAYNNDENNTAIYGRLYTFSALLQACPKGWHIPTDTEWMLLEKDLSLKYNEAGLVGSRGDIGGKFVVGGMSGFDALYGGWRHRNYFSGLASNAYFWTSTGYTTPIAYHQIKKGGAGVYRDITDRNDYLSLRCVKDYW